MKTILIITISLFSFNHLNAQNQLYVEQDGGERSILNFGKIGFDNYYFSNNSGNSDTLICSQSGLIDCEIKNYSMLSEKEKNLYQIYNKAIRKSIKLIKKSEKSFGEISLSVNGRTVDVRYFDYKKLGDLKMELSII